MKPPASLDPDMLPAIEIIQHAAEIVSRMPLAVLRAHLQQVSPDDPGGPWYTSALRLVESALLLELDAGRLSALEARVDTPPPPPPPAELVQVVELPDDWAIR